MVNTRLPILGPIIAPFVLWRFANQVQRYRRERAISERWTPALRAERLMFRAMAAACLGMVLVAAALMNPTTPHLVENTLWATAAIPAGIACLAAMVAGYHRGRQAREDSGSSDPAA